MRMAEHREPYDLRESRPVVCPVKAGMVSRGQTCRGRSQSPEVWIAEEREREPAKPIDKTSRGGVTSHRAVPTAIRIVASKMKIPEGRARNRRAKAE